MKITVVKEIPDGEDCKNCFFLNYICNEYREEEECYLFDEVAERIRTDKHFSSIFKNIKCKACLELKEGDVVE